MSSRFTLENPHIVLKLDPMASRMMFRRPDTGTRLESSIPTLSYLESGRPKRLTLMQVGSMGEMKPHAAPFRDHQSLRWEETVEGFKLALEWAIPSYAPHILWRWSLRNMRSDPIRLQRALMLACANQAFLEQTGAGGLCKGFPRGTLSRDGLNLIFPGLPATLAVYLPGWQSWSYGGWVMAEDRVPRSRLGPLTLPIIYDQARNPPRTQGHFRSEMFAAVLDTQTRANLTCGFLSQRQSFGSVDVRIHGDARALSVTMDLDGLKLDPNAEFHSDWACLQLGDHGVEGLEDYAALVGSFNQARVAEKASVGWCSWYGYGQAITEAEITANVEAASAVFDQTPSRVIQIDDGFQTEIGDWLSIGPAFPSGMRQVANTIKHAGYEAGIWLAPFIALSRSRVVKNHPDWILRSKWGMPANTGFVWNQFGRAFDPTHPGFLEYLQQVVATATADWGYAYLKLDFLYAGALAGIRHDPGYTRAQAFYKALRLIRETVGGSVTLVGCGCPLGAGIGIFDRMRIGPDVAAHWKPSIPPMTRLLSKEPTLPGAVNAIRNTLQRAMFHRHWWINDPDCLLVREENSALSLVEIQSLATAIGMSGGNLMLSDRFESISPERLELFKMLIPPLQGRMQMISPKDAHDYPVVILELHGAAGTWWLLACFNTTDQPHRSTLQLNQILPLVGHAHTFNLWQERYQKQDVSKPFFVDTQAHQVSLFGLRQMNSSPSWIGDNVHISQGSIVEQWRLERTSLAVGIRNQRNCDARFWIYLPGKILLATFNGTQIHPKQTDGLLFFQLDSIDEGVLEMDWSEVYDDH